MSHVSAAGEVTAKRRGRPPGSTNKPLVATAADTAAVA
jgi:hypothetical protein